MPVNRRPLFSSFTDSKETPQNPMLLELEDSQLVLVDYQERLLPALHGGDDALAQAVRLARLAQLMGVRCIATEQAPDKLGPSAESLRPWLSQTLAKLHFSACEEGLLDWLRPPERSAPARGNARSMPKHLQRPQTPAPAPRNTVVLAGCETHVCLLQTALELIDAEFDVWVVTDACASRTERNRDAGFDRLAANGVELLTTEMVAFEWLRSAEHAQFKAVQDLIK